MANKHTFESVFRFTIKTAKKTLKKFGNHVPLFILFNDKFEMTLVWVNMKNEEQKEITAKKVREMLKENNSIGYVAVMESWTLTGDVAKSHKFGTPLKEHPQRQECIAITLVTKGHKEDRMGMIPFTKRDGETIVFDEEIQEMEGLKVGGRFAELFEEEQNEVEM